MTQHLLELSVYQSAVGGGEGAWSRLSYSKANRSKQRRHICHAANTPVPLHNKHNTDPTGVRVWQTKAALKHKQHRRVTETPSVESSGRIHVATVSDTDKRS